METRAPYISVDANVYAAYLALSDGEVHETREVYPGILIDLDAADRLVGIEFLRMDVVEPLDILLTNLTEQL